ncbi:restriction endonuclease subunit S [Nocardia sp. NPDC047648]|uniref:restriction endonuclease subunit S n=1 Tax=Nocardia sp. NPDC047648 TaxID=3155625 RepID=UPI0034072A57
MSNVSISVPYGGHLPPGWKVVPLKYLASLQNGYSFKSDSWTESGTPIIRIDNLNGSEQYNYSSAEVGGRYQVHRGDLLYAWSGNPGTSFGPFRWDREGEFFLNQHIFSVNIYGCNKNWLYWSLKAATHWIEQALTSGMIGMVHVTKEELENVPIPIPPLEEQRRIADFLDAETSKVDLLVEASARQSDLLAERLQEAIRVATTTHSGPTASTGVDWMPHINAAWRLAKVGQVFMTGSGTTPSSEVEDYFNGAIPWVNSADLNDRGISSTIRNISHEALRDYPALKIHPAGSLIVAMYGQGETKGRVGLLEFDACVNQACCVLTPMDGINVLFVSYWFRAHKDGVVALAVGAGQPNLSQELIRQLRIPIPDVQWQGRIVAELQELEDSIATRSTFLDSRSRLLTEHRQALITAAVTGQIDVTTTTRRWTPSESVSV